MKRIHFILFALLLSTAIDLCAQHRFAFRNGKFRIAQFTDIHWDQKSSNCAKTTAVIRQVIATERPDIAILTGDIVTERPAREGWQSIINIFEQAKLPFVVTMGNHDAEVMPKAEIYRQLMASPYYAGSRGPESVSGYGNCTIPIYASDPADKEAKAVLYCIDSNDYQSVKEYGEYDWIHFDQIQWYRQTSNDYTRTNAGRPLPSLAFFHIPLREYNNVVIANQYLGNYLDGEVCASKVNSGMFAAFLDCKDVMGVFCGHDHQNDLIGMEFNVALAYGRVSGWDAYGDIRRGGRIIELYENQRKFDTWVRTDQQREASFYYPSALTSDDEARMTYLPAVTYTPAKHGVSYTYYEGKCKHTADIAAAKKVKEGTMKNFSIENARQPDHFAYRFRTLVKIDRRGVYRFYTYSDDGTKLMIDGTTVVDNDGGHSARRAEGKVALEAGYHLLELLYFEDYMGQALEVGYAGRDIPETVLPDRLLFIPPTKIAP